jgi:hypothetical protein
LTVQLPAHVTLHDVVPVQSIVPALPTETVHEALFAQS